MSRSFAQCDQCKKYACYSTGKEKEEVNINNIKWPANCPTQKYWDELKEKMNDYRQEPIKTLAENSYNCNILGSSQWCRVEEVMEFARLCNFEHLGIAYCSDLREEVRILGRVLRKNRFTVTAVPCCVGRPDWNDAGLEHPASVCNVIGQAAILNKVGTQLNIAMGHCVGDDSIFFIESKAPVTVLVCKDKLTGHNPIVAIYGEHKYFKERLANHPFSRKG